MHFYAYGTSQRGPSLKVPFQAVEKLDCHYLSKDCLRPSDTAASSPSSDSGYGSSLSTIHEAEKPTYELYIPSPSQLSRDEAFRYHLTTRNVFAYAVGQAVVGEKLSSALIDLWQRLKEWLPRPASISTFTNYLDSQGYLSFAQSSEHALACLKFAENARARDIWIDSFAHCVGMHERLYLSPEFTGLTNTTSALIIRASLEMDLHITRVTRAVGSFLEEELGTEHLGLSKPARDHLDHFRSFIHAFYVEKLGYFPPQENTRWLKSPWPAMHRDFHNLYQYLVDTDSSFDLTSTRAINGGVCVVQNVQAFDQRHGYEPLPHPLPLLPQRMVRQRSSLSSQTGLRTFKLGKANSVPEPKITPNQALAIATNCTKDELMLCPLVQEYQQFERQKLDSKLDMAEARKVRWLLIYGVFQMLNSIMRAPKEVRDTKTRYPLCLLTSGFPAWIENDSGVDDEPKDATDSPANALLVPDALDALEGRSSRISIHPDCEADSADDFFAANAIARHDSFNLVPAPLRVTTQLSRQASLRSSMHSSVQALHKSVVGSLSRRNSSRRGSLQLEPKKMRSYCEIVVEDYGNGMNWEDKGARPQTAFRSDDSLATETVNPFLEFDFDLAAVNDEPTLEDCQLGEPNYVVAYADEMERSPRDSNYSIISGDWIDSNRSSYVPSDSDDTDISSMDGGSNNWDNESNASSTPKEPPRHRQLASTPKQLCYRPSNPKLGDSASPISINGGCYTPTGMIPPPISKFGHQRMVSVKSVTSDSSSIYPEDSVQAADIEEVEVRGRQISRALERLSYQATESLGELR